MEKDNSIAINDVLFGDGDGNLRIWFEIVQRPVVNVPTDIRKLFWNSGNRRAFRRKPIYFNSFQGYLHDCFTMIIVGLNPKWVVFIN